MLPHELLLRNLAKNMPPLCSSCKFSRTTFALAILVPLLPAAADREISPSLFSGLDVVFGSYRASTIWDSKLDPTKGKPQLPSAFADLKLLKMNTANKFVFSGNNFIWHRCYFLNEVFYIAFEFFSVRSISNSGNRMTTQFCIGEVKSNSQAHKSEGCENLCIFLGLRVDIADVQLFPIQSKGTILAAVQLFSIRIKKQLYGSVIMGLNQRFSGNNAKRRMFIDKVVYVKNGNFTRPRWKLKFPVLVTWNDQCIIEEKAVIIISEVLWLTRCSSLIAILRIATKLSALFVSLNAQIFPAQLSSITKVESKGQMLKSEGSITQFLEHCVVIAIQLCSINSKKCIVFSLYVLYGFNRDGP